MYAIIMSIFILLQFVGAVSPEIAYNRVTQWNFTREPLTEPYVKVSLHTALVIA